MAKHPKLKDKLLIQQNFNSTKHVWDNKFKNEIKNFKFVPHGKVISRKPFMSQRFIEFFSPEDPMFW
jgi:hypothetical protein